jgi:hypothetical protein
MNAFLFSGAADWLALALLCAALACALGAALARSLFAMTLSIAACGVCAGVAALARAQEMAGLAQALIWLGVAPIVLLGALLLTTRTARSRKRRPPYAAMIAALAALAIPVWPAILEFRYALTPAALELAPIAALLGALAFVVAVFALGALGFGERGLFARARADDSGPAR